MTNDPKLSHMGMILSVIATGNDIVKATEKLMNDHPAEEYTIPTDVLLGIIHTLKDNTQLAANLFEENQTIADKLEKLVEKLEHLTKK